MSEFVSQVHKLDDRTYYIEQFDVRSYLFLGEEKALLWDTGFGLFEDFAETVAKITDLPLIVVNSHGHPDHSGSNHKFAEIYAHPLAFTAVRKYQTGDVPLKELNAGDQIDIGGRVFEVLHTPGHQIGHISLLNRAERTLIPGDILQDDHIVMYLNDGEDLEVYRDNLIKLKEMGTEYDTILPSHGVVPMGMEYFDKCINCTKAYLAGELTPTDMVGPEGSACKGYTLDGFTLML